MTMPKKGRAVDVRKDEELQIEQARRRAIAIRALEAERQRELELARATELAKAKMETWT